MAAKKKAARVKASARSGEPYSREFKEFKRYFDRQRAINRADLRLRAYVLDRNPQHIFDAFLELQQANITISPTMARNLAHAIKLKDQKPEGRPPENTLRHVSILQAIYRAYHSQTIPKRVNGKLLESLAQQWRTTVAVIKNDISWLRKVQADPAYEAPRAFTK